MAFDEDDKPRILNPDLIHESVRLRYADVAKQPQGRFPYPVGRSSALSLGYPPDLIDQIPEPVVERFVGVGNPFSLGEPARGERVVDIGCGAGFDSQLAAFLVGPAGRVLGVDLCGEMLAVARQGRDDSTLENLEFLQGTAESLPVESGWADLVVTNGVLNLAACKSSAFAEIARVLKPGGWLRGVDLVLVETLPDDLRRDEFAWSS